MNIPSLSNAPATLLNTGSHLRGMTRLAFDAVAGLTGLVETMHGNIASLRSRSASDEGAPTRGITTTLVYRGIRGVTGLTGAGVDAVLGMFDPLLPARHSAPGREAALAALNGVLGDHLAETANPLAIPMRLRQKGSPMS